MKLISDCHHYGLGPSLQPCPCKGKHHLGAAISPQFSFSGTNRGAVSFREMVSENGWDSNRLYRALFFVRPPEYSQISSPTSTLRFGASSSLSLSRRTLSLRSKNSLVIYFYEPLQWSSLSRLPGDKLWLLITAQTDRQRESS